MSAEAASRKTELTSGSVISELRRHGWNVKTGSAALGLCGGITTAVLGAIVTAVAWFTGPEWHGHFLQRDGTILLFLTIPLLVFGAHCLDLLDRQSDSRKTTESE